MREVIESGRNTDRARVALAAGLLGSLQVPHMFWETPADQYGTWTHGVSWLPDAPGRPTCSGSPRPSWAWSRPPWPCCCRWPCPVALVLLAGRPPAVPPSRSGRGGGPARAGPGVDLAYGWTWASTDRSRLARTIVWQESDVSDYRRFPARPVPTRPPVCRFHRSPAAEPLPVATVPVRQGGRVVERDLEEFLRSTRTTAFLAVKGDTLVSEVYLRGHGHDATVSSFSVAKPVVSALVGIAIAQGRIGSVDDPVTRYLPELDRRDPRFGRITLRHLVNPVLLGMVVERATGRTVPAYRSERLWGPLGMEADGSWSLDSRRSGLELLQAGLNGRAIDFAKFGAVYLHQGAWRGRQLVPRRWVADSTRADTRTDPSPRFQCDWWTRPGSGHPNDFWARATTASSSTCPPPATSSWSGSAPGTTTGHWPDLLAGLARRL